jgi:hypothetical protein
MSREIIRQFFNDRAAFQRDDDLLRYALDSQQGAEQVSGDGTGAVAVATVIDGEKDPRPKVRCGKGGVE